ncbi:MAG: Smr/MutS family protein [Deltaproteobacteria bacterium]|jgi:DNA-nicking Smr family endonuclease|nr:Smr/MutS family protein [Deltaproteobacteria bacterium]
MPKIKRTPSQRKASRPTAGQTEFPSQTFSTVGADEPAYPGLDGPFAALAGLRAKLRDEERSRELRAQEKARLDKKAKKAQLAAQIKRPIGASPVGASPVGASPVGERTGPVGSRAATELDEKDDMAYFLEAMEGVVPIADKNLSVPKPLPPERWRLPSIEAEERAVVKDLTDLVSGKSEFDFSATDELMEAQAKGLSPEIMRRLKRGLIPFQDHLDVHGFSLPEATEAINAFIVRSVGLGRKCLLLIHGRGHRSPDGIPIIKGNLEQLLLRGPIKKHILAFTTARPIDGGSGASYILLRG